LLDQKSPASSTPEKPIHREPIATQSPSSESMPAEISSLRARLLKAIGLLSLGLGFAGLVLPLLPTTPFILLSGWCFARSSPFWHKWIHAHKEFGPLIENWQRDRSVSLRHKIVAALIIFSSIGFIWLREQPAFGIKVAISSGLSTIFGFLLFTKTSPPRR